jgi:hypothetical protein
MFLPSNAYDAMHPKLEGESGKKFGLKAVIYNTPFIKLVNKWLKYSFGVNIHKIFLFGNG